MQIRKLGLGFLDAIKTFSMIVSHASRNKKARHLSHDATVHNVERMQVLLAMAQAVCSVRIEESALNVIKEEYGDEMQEMDAGSVETFKKMFKLVSRFGVVLMRLSVLVSVATRLCRDLPTL